MVWHFFAVTDRLTRNGITYEVGGQAPFDDVDPEVALLQSLGVLGAKGGSAPDPKEAATAGLPDASALPGSGVLHRDKKGKYALKEKLAAEEF